MLGFFAGSMLNWLSAVRADVNAGLARMLAGGVVEWLVQQDAPSAFEEDSPRLGVKPYVGLHAPDSDAPA